MTTVCDLTKDFVVSALIYEPDTGTFLWRNPAGRNGRIPAGSEAGTLNGEGYRYICLNGRHYRACRLAWLYVTGEWPSEQVDHRNRITSDDRWANLRLATPSQNKANCSLYRNNTSGFKGVYFDRERGHWRAKITIDGKRKWLGRFATREEAFAAYSCAAETVYGEFASPETSAA